MSQIDFKSNTVVRMTTKKQWDYLNRLTSISSSSSASASSSFNYRYNNANQRVQVNLADGGFWIYKYDTLGQVISGKKFWQDWTPVAGQQFEYGFDDIGNRTSTKAGGNEVGQSLRPASYSANSLNQYTSRDIPGAVDVMGLELATNSVTVSGSTAYRHGEYFRKELAVDNSSAARWTNITVAAPNETTVNGNVFVPKTPEQFGYDADGNLTNDGRWTYTWDAENRLINMTSFTGAPAGSKLKLDFAYDSKGRRIQKIVSTNNGSIYVPQSTNCFLYDGWNMIAVLSPNSSLLSSFLWGLDLSGSPQGAGGVGGLLAVGYHGAQTTNCFVAFDGNGNVAALVSAADGKALAQYEYGPFGEALRATGPMARANPCRFSSKYQDDETDLLYYGYRFYNPSVGRWVSRDPVKERGGANLYRFVKNAPIHHFDKWGMVPLPPPTHVGGEWNGPYGVAFEGEWIGWVDVLFNTSVHWNGETWDDGIWIEFNQADRACHECAWFQFVTIHEYDAGLEEIDEEITTKLGVKQWTDTRYLDAVPGKGPAYWPQFWDGTRQFFFDMPGGPISDSKPLIIDEFETFLLCTHSPHAVWAPAFQLSWIMEEYIWFWPPRVYQIEEAKSITQLPGWADTDYWTLGKDAASGWVLRYHNPTR